MYDLIAAGMVSHLMIPNSNTVVYPRALWDLNTVIFIVESCIQFVHNMRLRPQMYLRDGPS